MTPTAAPGLPADLIEQALGGDRQAIGRLAERYRGTLLARVRLMLGEEARRCADSIDFVQGALLEVLRCPPAGAFTDEEQLLRWLTAAARNDIRNAGARRRERALESLSASLCADDVPAAGPSPASAAGSSEEVLRLLEALEALADDHRRVIELRDLEQLPFAEVGRRLGRSEAAAQMLHARAVARLGRAMRHG